MFEKVRNLNLPIGTYAFFGSAPLAVRGLRDIGDIDLIVSPEIWQQFENKAEWEHRTSQSGSPFLMNNGIELFQQWRPGQWDIKELIREADIIDGLPFVKLSRVLAWKKLRGKEKDIGDIKTIEDFLQSQK